MANMKRTTIMLPVDMHRCLNHLKDETGVGVGGHIRLALAEYLNHHPLYGGPEGGGP